MHYTNFPIAIQYHITILHLSFYYLPLAIMFYKIFNKDCKCIEIIESNTTNKVFDNYNSFQPFCRKDDLKIKSRRKNTIFIIKWFWDFVLRQDWLIARITYTEDNKKRYSYTGFSLNFEKYIKEYLEVM